MTTTVDVLTSAERWLGTTEQPLGSNNVPGITDWYGIRGAWCAMFISRVFYDAGMPLPASTPKGFAWVSAGFNWMRQQGWHMFTDWRQAQPGDLIAWEWGTTAGGYDHISMVWKNDEQFVTIGGNERDRVKFEFFGAPGGAALFARPPFDDVSTPAPPPTPQTVWRRGSSGNFVREIQRIVGTSVDGSFGPATEAAVKVWQAKVGVAADGVWGPATQLATDRLFAYLAGIGNTSPSMDPGLAAFLTALNAATRQVLRMGSSGDAVKILQTLLEKKGIPVGGIDGKFGPGTNHAVTFFQRDRGLAPDGIVGPVTWAALVQP